MRTNFKNISLNFLFLISMTYNGFSQTELEWVKQFGGTKTDYGDDILFAQGNIYLRGAFYDSLDIDPGPLVKMLYTEGEMNSFVAKFDSNGNFIWARQLISQKYNAINKIYLHNDSELIAIGKFTDSLDFDPGSGTQILYSEEVYSGFMWKLDTAGNSRYAGAITATDYCQPRDIISDSEGNIFITGSYGGTADFNPGVGVDTLSAQAYSAFVCKYDSSFNLIWANQFENHYINESGSGYSLASDLSNNIYIGGKFFVGTDFDPGPGEFIIYGDYDGDGFVCKLDSDGNFLFAVKIGAAGNESVTSNLIISGDSTLLVSGYYNGTCYFDTTCFVYLQSPQYANSLYLCKYSLEGEYIWAKALLAEPYEGVYTEVLRSDSQGNTYLAGSFMGTVDFDFGADEYFVTSNGFQDTYICMYDSVFNLQWINTFDTDDSYVISCCPDNSGHLYCAGSFDNTVDFDPGQGTYNLTSNGKWDGFILKLHDVLTEVPSYLTSSQISFYPNPAEQEFSILFQPCNDNLHLDVTNITGKIMSEINIPANQSSVLIGCKSWPPGVYLGQLISDGKIVAKGKVIVK